MAASDNDDIPRNNLVGKPDDPSPSPTDLNFCHHGSGSQQAQTQLQGELAALTKKNQALLRQCRMVALTKDHYARLYEKYANFFDFSPSGYIILNHQGKIQEANLTAAMMLNVPKVDLVGRKLSEFVHRDDRRTFTRLKHRCELRAEIQIGELTMVPADGPRFTAQLQLQAFPDKRKPVLEFRGAIVDMSEKTLVSNSLLLLQHCTEIASRVASAEQLLKENVSRIKTYMECAAVGIRVRDGDGNIPYKTHMGFSSEFVKSESRVSLHQGHCMCSRVMQAQTDVNTSFMTTKGSFYINNTSRWPSMETSTQVAPTRNECLAQGFESVALIPIAIDGDVMGLIHVADMNKNKVPLRMVEILESVALRIGLALQRFSIQDQLRRSNEALRHLSSSLLKAQEEEQRRLAMELHDQTGQDLNVLKLRLKAVQKRLRKDQPELKENCTHILTFTDKIIDDIRRLAHGLNPSALEVLGLNSALVQMAREMAEYSKAQIDIHIDPLKQISDRNRQTGIFRIVQEALNNISKHARAKQVSIKATQAAGGLSLTIEDNGIGFKPKNENSQTNIDSGMGLSAMRLRARMIGGRITIASKPGKGTQVELYLPVKRQ